MKPTDFTAIDLNELAAFRAAVRFPTFTQAAQHIHLSQPAFSRRIDKLEQGLGVQLFQRSTRRITLTAVGKEFERRLEEVFSSLEATVLHVRGAAAAVQNTIAIACVPSVVNYFLTKIILAFHKKHPNVYIRILDDNAEGVLRLVAEGTADFGLNFIGVQQPDLEFAPLLEEEFVVACRRDHPLAKRQKIRWSELSGYTYISVGKNSGNRLILDQAIAGSRQLPESMFETQHVTTMLGLVEAGIGIAVVPSIAAPKKHHPLVVSVALHDPVIRRKIGLIKKKGRVLQPAAQRFYDLCL